MVRHWMANTGCSLLLYRALPPVVIEFFTPKRQQFSLSFNMPVSTHTKKKQTIAFGRCIKDSADVIEIKPCSVYVLSGRKYVFD
jgi:hypothetical protein